MELAIRHHLNVELNDDPELQASLSEALALIFKEFQDNWSKIYEELEKLRQRIINASKEPTYGLHRKKQMPFFRSLKREVFETNGPASSNTTFEPTPAYGYAEDENISMLVNLTQQVYLVIERELKLTGFWESGPARNKLRSEIQQILLQPAFYQLPGIIEKREQIISRLMEIAKKNNDIILYAE